MPQLPKNIQIFRVGRERLNDLEPLWKALHTHHVTVTPQFGPTRSPDESWLRRKSYYEQWLNEPDTFILMAEKTGHPIGYAFVRIMGGFTTWRTADKVAEIETLSILPEFRGLGVGSNLMAAIYAELRKDGIEEVSLGVVATNLKAIRFYERHGFEPRILNLWGRVTPNG